MTRRKSRSSDGDISQQSIFTVVGIVLGSVGLVITLSLLRIMQQGSSGIFALALNDFLFQVFGPLAICIPVIFLLFAAHALQFHRFHLLPWRFTLGLISLFMSVAALLQVGIFGNWLWYGVAQTLNTPVAYTVYIMFFMIGIAVFFDITPVHIVHFIRSFHSAPESDDTQEFITHIRPSKQKSKTETKPKDTVLKTKKKASLPTDDGFIRSITPLKRDKKDLSTKTNQIPATRTKPDFVTIRPITKDEDEHWKYPPLHLLADINSPADRGDTAFNSTTIEKTLQSHGIKARIVDVNGGPTVTQYALEVAVGTSTKNVVNQSQNLALALASKTGSVRIEAPIPGKSLIGIEIPNIKAEIVTLKRLLTSKVFTESSDPLLVPLGLDVSGEVIAASITKMPHVLIAGTTGSGKSVAINAWISTVLMRTKPSEVRLILVDPKQVELTTYNGVQHLLAPVITDAARTVNALKYAVVEMERRYKLLSEKGVRNIDSYNALPEVEKLYFILFVIDELADLMMTAKSDIEGNIVRIAQKARAVGIHLILATQRPSVNVITGIMKANVPTRLAFNVASGIDSKVIIDSPGAEELVGKGDMLYSSFDSAKPKRIQGPFVSEKEVHSVVQFLKDTHPEVHYTEEVTEPSREDFVQGPAGTLEEKDPLFDAALDLIRNLEYASTSSFQSRLKLGFARAKRVMDQLEAAGYVGPATAPGKPRTVLPAARSENLQTQ